MYLRASNVSLHFKLDKAVKGDETDRPVSELQSQLGGAVETSGNRRLIRAIDDVSLELRQGDRLAIIGHNGSGKSTLLKILAGIYHPQQGSVESDHPVTGMFNISLGFRQEASGYRNIMLKGLIAGKSRAQIERAIPEIAEFTELGPYLHMPLRTYSQGMSLRLAFSIATAFSSDILLMDEWIGAGDARFSEKIIRRMNSFVESAHILVVASHSAPLLRRITNRAIWLESGRIRESGPVNELLDRYEAEAKASIRAARAAQPIRKEGISLTVTPSELPDFRPGDRGVIGELSWDASESGVDHVDIYVVTGDGKERLCVRGQGSGHYSTGPWIKPGVGFRLRDAATDELLVSTTVLPDPKAQQAEPETRANSPAARIIRKEGISLTVNPPEMPDYKPGDRGIAGQISWDASTSGVDIVDIYALAGGGQERLCARGRDSGYCSVGPWIRPGIVFLLRDAVTNELLASTTVLPDPQAQIADAAQ